MNDGSYFFVFTENLDTDDSAAAIRKYNSNHTANGNDILVNTEYQSYSQKKTRVIKLKSMGFLVSWVGDSDGTSNWEVYY